MHTVYFEKTQMERMNWRFLCFRWHIFAVILDLTITGCWTTNTSQCYPGWVREGKKSLQQIQVRGNKVVKKLYSSRQIWHKAMWSCLSVIKRNCVLGDQHWLSNQCSGEQRILASTTPRGGNECSPCFRVDLSLVDMSCFSPRLIQRVTGSFEPFLQGDMDVVIWIELLGPDSWWHGFLRIQANSWLPCREPL